MSNVENKDDKKRLIIRHNEGCAIFLSEFRSSNTDCMLICDHMQRQSLRVAGIPRQVVEDLTENQLIAH